MFELWFAIVAVMLTAYVVLDGFDFGAGAVHFVVAKTEDERREVISAIGPFWDANEVWLLAFGGALFVAFPRALSAGLSGFYLAIFLVVWCLILRAVAIEFRGHLASPLWRRFWDTTFALASALLAVLFGAALGNLLRGVPLDADGWFALTLFTTFLPREPVGVLDVYTVLAGGFALLALAAHGATYLAWRTTGIVEERSRALARRLWVAAAVAWPLVTLATHRVRPGLFAELPERPLAWAGLALAIVGITDAIVANRRGRALAAFLGSCAFLSGVLITTAVCLFPEILPSSGARSRAITAFNAGGTEAGLRIALGWWSLGFPLAIGYFVLLFRLHRAKRSPGAYGADH